MTGSRGTRGDQRGWSQRHGFETLGPIAMAFGVFLVLRVLFFVLSLPNPPVLAAVGTVTLLALWIVWRRKARQRKAERLLALRQELGTLKDQELKLRYQEAKDAGKLDRWTKETSQ